MTVPGINDNVWLSVAQYDCSQSKNHKTIIYILIANHIVKYVLALTTTLAG
jgi:hypothetical protein